MDLDSVPMDMCPDPLKWWKHHQDIYPNLSRMAKDHLCITATSVPSERLFSAAGDIITSRRNKLHPEVVEATLCLDSWWAGNVPGLKFEV